MEYEERMEELEKLEYPKPNREFIYDTFNAFLPRHTRGSGRRISARRRSPATCTNVHDVRRVYSRLRAAAVEGVLLRYLSETYKVLVQTVPESERTDEIMTMIEYFGEMIRGIDASLLEEWERMRKPGSKAAAAKVEATEPDVPDITRNKREFTVLVRNAVF